jgi:hypothetical protein
MARLTYCSPKYMTNGKRTVCTVEIKQKTPIRRKDFGLEIIEAMKAPNQTVNKNAHIEKMATNVILFRSNGQPKRCPTMTD